MPWKHLSIIHVICFLFLSSYSSVKCVLLWFSSRNSTFICGSLGGGEDTERKQRVSSFVHSLSLRVSTFVPKIKRNTDVCFVPRCWAVNENMNYWWIIRFPVLFATLVKMTYTNTLPSVYSQTFFIIIWYCCFVWLQHYVVIFWSTDQLFNFLEDPGGDFLQTTSQQSVSIPRLQTQASCLSVMSL